MIIAAAPGGVTSNILTKFANGDVPLSISLTAVVSLISIISVPFIVITSADIIGISISSDISMTGIALKMALVVTVPVIIGMVIRGFVENFILSKINIINKITGGLFVLEAVSVIIQVFSFKLTGKRIFKMAPIHHHFEKKGWPESTVVIRFWIISIILAMIGLATLKFR